MTLANGSSAQTMGTENHWHVLVRKAVDLLRSGNPDEDVETLCARLMALGTPAPWKAAEQWNAFVQSTVHRLAQEGDAVLLPLAMEAEQWPDLADAARARWLSQGGPGLLPVTSDADIALHRTVRTIRPRLCGQLRSGYVSCGDQYVVIEGNTVSSFDGLTGRLRSRVSMDHVTACDRMQVVSDRLVVVASGRYLATWDASDWRRRSLRELSFAFRPVRRGAANGTVLLDTETSLVVFDATDGRIRYEFSNAGQRTIAAAIDATARWCGTVDHRGCLRVWNLYDGRMEFERTETALPVNPMDVALCATRRWIITRLSRECLGVWSFQDDKLVHEIPLLEPTSWAAIELTSDESFAIVRQEHSLLAIDLDRGEVSASLRLSSDKFGDSRIARGLNSVFALASEAGNVLRWDFARDDKSARIIASGVDPDALIEVHPSGRVVYSSNACDGARMHVVAQADLLALESANSFERARARDVRSLHNEQRVLTLASSGSVALRETQSLRVLASSAPDPTVYTYASDDHASCVSVVSNTQWTISDLTSSANVLMRKRLGARETGVTAVAPDGRAAAFGNVHGEFWVWRRSTRTAVRAHVHRVAITTAAIARDESFAVSGDSFGQLKFLPLVSENVCAGWIDAHDGAVASVQIVSNSSVITSGDDGSVARWDITTGRRLGRHTTLDLLSRVVISSDGRSLLLAHGRGDISCLDAETLSLRWSRKLHRTEVTSLVALHASGGYMASIDGRGSILVWSAETGDPIARWFVESPARGLAASDRMLIGLDGRGILQVLELTSNLQDSTEVDHTGVVAQVRRWVEDYVSS